MDKSIGIAEARTTLREIVDQVQLKGESYIIKRNGKPAAAVVPVAVYENWKRERKAFFDQVRVFQQRANLDPAEADQLAAEAIRAVRKGRKK
ncbi:MAG: type II toxin-antitoxin system prevent-host-death family antitoxin [Chloroflexi bacterium]|nr:type II toxin-antitoxin system prevent-host-death family antitoxin [Chloroflexota bacterium]